MADVSKYVSSINDIVRTPYYPKLVYTFTKYSSKITAATAAAAVAATWHWQHMIDGED